MDPAPAGDDVTRRLPTAMTRTLVAGALGAVGWSVGGLLLPWQVAVLVGWDAVALTAVAWVLVSVLPRTSHETRHLATRVDDSRTIADITLTSASVVSLVGVGFALVKASRSHGAAQALITGVAVATVVLSWAAVQVVYLLRYAHLYYSGTQGGISFNEDDDPDYHDFTYLAVTIGMTYQVSDTNLENKAIRRTATRHGLLSYVFGTFVVAMTINVVAGLLK